MDSTTIAHDARPSTPIEQIAERVEEELARLRAARPALSSRIKRAENILVTHLSCRRQRIIRVRVGGDGWARFLVQGSGGAVYVVDPTSWQCSCPDAHRRGKGCKHGIACWALARASHGRPAPILADAAGEDLPVEDLEHVSEILPRALSNVADGDSLRGVVPLDVVMVGLDRMSD